MACALQSRLGIQDPGSLAAALLRSQGAAGPANWATTGDGLRVNDGRYSPRNPATRYSMADNQTERLARIANALNP